MVVESNSILQVETMFERTRKIKIIFTVMLLSLAASALSGCVYMEVQTGSESERPLFHPSAVDLKGAAEDAIVVEAKETLIQKPLHTHLIREVAEKSRQAVVSVYAQTKTPYRITLFPIPLPGMGVPVRVPGVGLGSGFFIHPSGYLLTNDHVVRLAEKVNVLTQDGTDFEVIIVARDPVYDLALLKVIHSDQEFQVLPMGDSKKIDSGDMVIAVGNPLGLGHTVTSGIISHTGRNLSGEPEKGKRQIRFIQTDAAINPGSSGGPLITLSGAWVGVNTAGAASGQGIGFAVPSEQVREFLNMLRTGEWKTEGDPEK
jgi:serine protease Do